MFSKCLWIGIDIPFGDVGRVVKNGRTYPVQRDPDGRVVKPRDQIVRRIYDLGRVVKPVLQKCRGIDICMCPCPYQDVYCSDNAEVLFRCACYCSDNEENSFPIEYGLPIVEAIRALLLAE